MTNKIENIIFYIFLGIIIIFIFFVIGIMIDFYNDYKCSTTNDNNYFVKNKCERYLK